MWNQGNWSGRLLTDGEHGQLCSSLLHKLAGRAKLGKKPHVVEVAAGEPLHFRKCGPEVGGKLIDHLGTPALAALAFEDFPADVVVEADLLGIGGQQGSLAGTLDAGFQADEPVGVIGWERENGFHAFTPIFSRWAATLAASCSTSSTICGSGAA
jgi:hypothetical protein